MVLPGRRIVQSVVDCSPDLLLASHSLGDPPMASVVKGVRQALGGDVRILVLYGFDPQGAPSEVDDVQRAEPLQPTELQIRVSRLLRELAERRVLQKKTSELLGLYKMSWAFSLVGGADALYGHLSRHSAEMLKAERGLLLLYDSERRQLVGQAPGFGLTPEQIQRVRYKVDGEADGRWNFRKNGPLLSNKAQADTRLLPELAAELQLQSLMIAPITRGPKILGLLAVADRIGRAPFSDDDLNLLLALAGQATIAVENLRLHDELKKANTLLQEYDRLKSEFVGIVAHDFRRPLMAIRGFAELVLEEEDLPPETRHEFMRTVISETDHLALLANDTLLITQIETGQLSFNFREVDVGPVPARGGAPRPLRPLGPAGRAARVPEDLGGPRSAPPDAEQPRLERRQVLALRWLDRRPGARARHPAHRDRGGGQRAGDPAGAGGQALPEVRARAQRRAPQGLRHRARALHLPSDRRGPRRADLGRIGDGPREHLRDGAADRRPAGAAAAPPGGEGGRRLPRRRLPHRVPPPIGGAGPLSAASGGAPRPRGAPRS